jgi:hypothetical protein
VAIVLRAEWLVEFAIIAVGALNIALAAWLIVSS